MDVQAQNTFISSWSFVSFIKTGFCVYAHILSLCVYIEYLKIFCLYVCVCIHMCV